MPMPSCASRASLGEGADGVERQRHLHRALALRAHEAVDLGALRQVDPEVRVAVADRCAPMKGSLSPRGQVVDAAVGVAQ